MAKELFFSIVMPVYDVENYLRDAVESILAQTYTNFELILVDDCSTDNSSAICDELSLADPRIKVIHKQENDGLSMARNSGIDAAVGDYIYFMDSDDTIDNNLFADVAYELKQFSAQVVMFGMIEEYFSETEELKKAFKVCYPKKSFNDQTKLREEIINLENSTLYGYSCNKFYDLKYLNKKNIRFLKVTMIEDIKFNVEFFMDISSLIILDTTPYQYKKRSAGSLTARFVPDYFDLHTERVQMIKDQYLYFQLYSANVKQILGNIYCRYIYSALQRNCDERSNMTHKDRRDWIRNLFSTDLFLDVIPAAKPESWIVKILARFLQKKSVFLTLLSSRAIFIVKEKLPILFAKAKQKR